MKGYSIVKMLEKLIRGGAAGLVGTILAYLTDTDPMVAVPLVVGLFEAIYNAVKFFIKNKGGE
ncbi:MAG: hypothetical protein PHF74_08170 [Dehalococcoidales bacterium]|nr:hypothetical protein [Dehalococcoidales bacterium]